MDGDGREEQVVRGEKEQANRGALRGCDWPEKPSLRIFPIRYITWVFSQGLHNQSQANRKGESIIKHSCFQLHVTLTGIIRLVGHLCLALRIVSVCSQFRSPIEFYHQVYHQLYPVFRRFPLMPVPSRI